VRQQRQGKDSRKKIDDLKTGRENFGRLKWKFFPRKVIRKNLVGEIFFRPPKLGARSPPMLILGLTLRPNDAIIIDEDKQQRAMSEVDLKSKVGCFLPKSSQVVLGTSRRLEVDLGSLLYQLSGVGLAH